ncbi:MAG: polysaccharide biosynthesis protein [Clostridia bacterium]|nr:polysaccharide biosynthesis protein [Clostridia bacterium]
MGKNKKMGFIEGAMIIAVANILVKIIGAVFKIPLDTFVLQTDGMALYNTSYMIYNLLFVISTAGLPTAISKLVAESDSTGDYDGSKKILKVSLVLLLCIGGIGSLVLFAGAKFFSGLLGYPDAYLTMIAMSPSLLFVAGMSAFRGYFQGHGNMFPTAISEVIEASCKLFVGLSLAYMLLPMGKMYASAGAIFGVTVGSIIGIAFLFAYYIKGRKNEKKSEKTALSSKRVLINIVKIAVPITLGVSVFTLTSFIDTAMVTNQMKGYIATSDAAENSVLSNLSEERAEAYKEIPSVIEESGAENKAEKLKENKAAFVYGYLVRAITLFNMPAVIISAIATSAVPAIASANAEGDRKKSRSFTKSALLITVVLALPCAMGMSILAKPILSLIYGDGSFSVLLNVMGIAVLFLTLVQIVNALLQSWGKVWIPVINMLIGGAVKIFVNLILVGRPEINIMGAPIGTLLCYITVATLNITALCKNSGIRPDFKGFVLKPVFCGAVMGIFTFGVQYALSGFAGEKIAMLISIGVSVIVYFAAIIFTKTLKREEILLLPKGEKLLAVMEKAHLI